MSIPYLSDKTIPIRIELEPVFNALYSFSLLNKVEQQNGLNTWVVQTASMLTPEQRHINRLVFEGLRDAVTPLPDEPNFPSYLHNLTEQNPFLVRKMVIEPLRKRFSRLVPYATPDTKHLFNDIQTYLDCVKRVQGEGHFDAQMQTEVHHLLQDPPALQQLILSHLELMWKTTFVAEWRRVQSSLRWQVEMFANSIEKDASIESTFRTLTGRELPPDAAGVIAGAEQIVLIPSWHAGRQVGIWEGADWERGWKGLHEQATVRLFFSEPPNYDVAGLRAIPVGRNELRARLNILADETRLRIIELLVQRDELAGQDIIASLELSQPNVSRNLKQLVSMGYLYERRGEGANKTYRLSSFYFGRTVSAIEQLLSGETAHPKYSARPGDEILPQTLRRFLDDSGRLTIWPPSRQADKRLLLEYLAGFFEVGRVYTEKEVNDLLLLHMTFKDAASLRRALCEYNFMDRKQDGSQYWLIEPKP